MRNVLIALMFSLLCGCATLTPGVETKVTAFHVIDQSLLGETFAIVPGSEQESSLEFQAYAKLVKAELEKKGLVEEAFSKAKYAVFMFYGIDSGMQIVSSYPIFGQTGGGNAYTTGIVATPNGPVTYSGTTYTTPTYGYVGDEIVSYTHFTRYLNLDILEIAKSGNGKVHKVYEGKALSTGTSNQLSQVMPAIVRTVFEDFPGRSGVARTSEYPLADDPKK